MAGKSWNGAGSAIRTRNIVLQDWERKKAKTPLGKICFSWQQAAAGLTNCEAWLYVNGYNGRQFGGIYAGSLELKKPLTGAEKPQVFMAIFGELLAQADEMPVFEETGILPNIEDITTKAKAYFEKWNS